MQPHGRRAGPSLAKTGNEGKTASQRTLEILGDTNVVVLPVSVCESSYCVSALRAAARTRPPQRAVRDCSTNAKPPWPALARFLRPRSRFGATPTSKPASSNWTGKRREGGGGTELVGHVIWEKIVPQSSRHRILSALVIWPWETQQHDRFEGSYKTVGGVG